jgi:hypothetical protein
VSNAADFFTQAIAENPEAGKATFNDEPLPEGMYPLVVESCELRKYVDGVKRKPEDIAQACGADPSLIPGVEIAVTYVVTEGKFAKRKLFGSYCIVPASNQRTFPVTNGEPFTPERQRSAAKENLCGLMIRLGRPESQWNDWTGRMFNGYVTRKMKNGVVRNNIRCKVQKGEENAPKPSAPQNTTPHGTDEPPF